MVKFFSRISRSTVYSFCLVTATFWAILLLLHVIDKVSLRRSELRSAAGNSAGSKKPGGPKNRNGLAATAFSQSPYNAANKRGSSAEVDPNATPKYIYWQAARTLRVLSTTSEVFENCPVSACIVSPSSKFYQKANAIVFDEGRMNKQTPPQLTDKRMLVYYNMRTPSQMYFKAKGELFGQYWTSAINWVWSYRLDSDIFEPFAYLVRQPLPGELDTFTAIAKKKSKLAVWIDARVDRKEDSLEDVDKSFQKAKSQTDVEGYVRKLEKVMTFDTYNIMNFKEALDDVEAKKPITLSKYYFVLAFEWADCQDYVTDLFFDVFDPRILAVPVVRGGVNYTKYFPKEIFVDADAYKTPRELAKHLEKVAANTKLYSRMLWKKSEYLKENGVYHAWCQLCDMLHRVDEDSELRKRYNDIHAWYKEGGGCQVRSNTSDTEVEVVGTNATRYQLVENSSN